ncbi:MAG: hypothetical protein C0417_07420 [Chlorobiaceae bacterium]|nr:hypothetical protein [Chlorobiaceae bacterium]
MKIKSLVPILLLFVLTSVAFCADQKKINEFVDVKVSLKQKEVKPGSTCDLLIRFKPKQGIHINFEPPISVKFDSTLYLNKVEKLIIPRKPKQEYFDHKQDLIQKFSITKDTPPGDIVLKGTLIYFYCSGSDGWCSRYKHPFEVSVKVKK